ncbi:hypothetical protein G7054_g5855 [Neopestalotiopsis clavispora]|nr:hypothetical protein G7054_g5855 [Neopestalotiopsis clavispora]
MGVVDRTDSFCALLPLSDTPGITQRPGVHATSPPLLPTIRCLLDFLAARAGVCCGKELVRFSQALLQEKGEKILVFSVERGNPDLHMGRFTL